MYISLLQLHVTDSLTFRHGRQRAKGILLTMCCALILVAQYSGWFPLAI